MSRLRAELAFLCTALVVWEIATHADRLVWLLTMGFLLGALAAMALSFPRPWDPK
jgi:hypothetical protein